MGAPTGERIGLIRPILAATAAALTFHAAPALAAKPVEGYQSPDHRVGCVMYQNFDSDGNAVKCGRRGSNLGLLLRSAGFSLHAKWSWPARQLGSLFFQAKPGQTLYLYGGTAKLQGDDSILRCRFALPAKVLCTNGDGYAIEVTRTRMRRISPQ
jgi:hypothetical protein